MQVYLLDFGFSVSPASQPSYFDIHFDARLLWSLFQGNAFLHLDPNRLTVLDLYDQLSIVQLPDHVNDLPFFPADSVLFVSPGTVHLSSLLMIFPASRMRAEPHPGHDKEKELFHTGVPTPAEIWIFPAEGIHCPTKNPLIPSWHSGSPDKSTADSAFLPAEVSGSIRLCQTLESTSAVFTTITV